MLEQAGIPKVGVVQKFTQEGKMTEEMQYKQSPKDHLKTWEGLTKVSIWTCAAVVLLLVILAITLV